MELWVAHDKHREKKKHTQISYSDRIEWKQMFLKTLKTQFEKPSANRWQTLFLSSQSDAQSLGKIKGLVCLQKDNRKGDYVREVQILGVNTEKTHKERAFPTSSEFCFVPLIFSQPLTHMPLVGHKAIQVEHEHKIYSQFSLYESKFSFCEWDNMLSTKYMCHRLSVSGRLDQF